MGNWLFFHLDCVCVLCLCVFVRKGQHTHIHTLTPGQKKSITTYTKKKSLLLQTWVRQGHPPNLSILLSGGKENNRDSLSERRAKRDRTRCRIGSYMALSCGKNASSWLVWDWRNSMCKANPLLNTTLHVSIEPKKVTAHWAKNPSISLASTKRVALLGSEASIGRYVSAKVKYRVGRPISNK